MSSTSKGRQAEAVVSEYLSAQGYSEIDRNWRNQRSEIDLIMEKDDTVYFFEVKYRHHGNPGLDFINQNKLHRMKQAALAWSVANDWEGPYELGAAEVSGDFSVDEVVVGLT